MNKFIETLVFVLIGVSINAQSELSNINYNKKQPAAIVEYSKDGVLQLDFVEYNSNFKPGSDGEDGNYFLNRNKKLRTFKLAKNAKYYECNGTIANTERSLSVLYNHWCSYTGEYYLGFDFKNGEIISIYEQCLP